MTAEQRWLEAGRILALDPHSPVRCPRIEDDTLAVTDVPLAGQPGPLEPHPHRPTCGAHDAIPNPTGVAATWLGPLSGVAELLALIAGYVAILVIEHRRAPA
jgi:hypothetical protein